MGELHINALPTHTWNWLKLNDTKIAMPETSVSKTENYKIENIPDGVSFQKKSLRDFSFAKKYETALGESANVFFTNENCFSLTAGEETKTKNPIFIFFSLSEKNSASVQLIHAKENAHISVVFVFESEQNSRAAQFIKTICCAEKNARISIFKVNLSGNECTLFDDTISAPNEHAIIDVKHITLGGKNTYIASSAALDFFASRFTSTLSYLCAEKQTLDMNFIVRHRGKKTSCDMNVLGTLKDNAKKIYRGSIDFKNGASGSVGKEMEETLLLSPLAINKSIPLILCDEEDVSGEHGATIGKLHDEILFYLASRGIEKKVAEILIARAKILQCAEELQSDAIVKKINARIDEAFLNEKN